MIVPETDAAFIEWIEANQSGYVLNSDKARKDDAYPKLHRAGCATYQDANRFSGGELKKYVTGDWDKFCSTEKGELEEEGVNDPRGLKLCGVCKP
jgi:hypothetical protein